MRLYLSNFVSVMGLICATAMLAGCSAGGVQRNESGQIVSIPHVIAAYYDTNGKVIWVSDGYVAQALLPQTPVSFAVDLPADIAKNVQTYRVIVNHYEQTT